MAKIDFDTLKIKEIGNDIIELSGELNNALESLYSRMENMPTKTKEWIGKSANDYVKILKKEKERYMDFKDTICDYGEYLVDLSTRIDIVNKKNSML